MSQLVTLVNRTSKTLKGTWDGRHYDIAPGQHSFPEIQAQKFMDQNPVMGSEDPRTLVKDFLMGIIEHGDDISPIEQSNAIELMDRSKIPVLDGDKYVIVRANGMYSPQRDAAAPLPQDSLFTKP